MEIQAKKEAALKQAGGDESKMDFDLRRDCY